MTCLSVDNVTIYMLRNVNSAVSFSLILSNPPQFLELHYYALLGGDGFISLSCSVFALLKNLVCSLSGTLLVYPKRMAVGVKPRRLFFIPLYVFFLGDTFNGSIFFDIRGQHGGLKVIKMTKSHLPGNRHKTAIKNKQVEDMQLLGPLYMTMHVREGNSEPLLL